MAYMFQDEGNITFGNETSEMRKGMLKFNIQVERGIVNGVSIKSWRYPSPLTLYAPFLTSLPHNNAHLLLINVTFLKYSAS